MPKQSGFKGVAAKPKLTDADRLKRFKALAKEVGATEDAPGFDGTLERLAAMPKEPEAKR
jgi:hypothetical protein